MEYNLERALSVFGRGAFVAGMMGVGLAALPCFTSCTKGDDSTQRPTNVRVETALPAGGGASVQYPGKVKAAQDACLAFRVGGVIKRYCVEEGAHVSKGQLLAVLDDTDYRVQLSATEAEYEQVKAQTERIISLYKDSVATPNDYDKAVYGLRQIQAKLQNHKDQLSYTKLYAPFSGCIQKHLYEGHEAVGAGTPVVSMVGDGALEVEINLPAADYVARDAFKGYQCTFNVYPGEVYNLVPISITPKANSNQLYTVRLQLQTEGKPQPAAGMSAMVTIITGEKGEEGASAIKVPSSAVLNTDGKSYVFVYEPEGSTLRRCEVTMKEVLADGYCIVETGEAAAGEKVVSSGIHHVGDGEKVTLLPEDNETNAGGLL